MINIHKEKITNRNLFYVQVYCSSLPLAKIEISVWEVLTSMSPIFSMETTPLNLKTTKQKTKQNKTKYNKKRLKYYKAPKVISSALLN